MARSTGTMKLSSNFEPRLGAPLDGRMVVPTLADLTTSGNFPYPYKGMIVAVQATCKLYVYNGGTITSSSSWEEVGGSSLSGNVGNTSTPIYLSNGVLNAVTAKFLSANNIGETAITDGQDLNEFTTIGVYGTSGGNTGSSVATSLLNKPTFAGGFRMYVESCGGDMTYLRQTIITKAGLTFTRTSISLTASPKTWTDWKQVATLSDIPATPTLASLMGSSAKGGTTQPIYWNGSAFVNTSYTLGKSVPSNAIFTDTTYTNGTGLSLSGTTFSISQANVSTILNLLSTGDSDAQAADYVICQFSGGGTSTTTYHRRPLSKVVNATAVKAALGTVTTTANKYLRDDGTWQAVTATDSTKLPLAGGTMTGVLNTASNMYTDSRSYGALDLKNSNIIGVNAIYMADASDNAGEAINWINSNTTLDSLWASGGVLLFTPNRADGTATTVANSQKVGRFTTNPTSGQVVVTDGTSGGIKSSGYTIAKSVPSDAVFTDNNTTYTFASGTNGFTVTPSGGSAQTVSVTATKVGSSTVGSAVTPVYLNSGTITQCQFKSQYSGQGAISLPYHYALQCFKFDIYNKFTAWQREHFKVMTFFSDTILAEIHVVLRNDTTSSAFPSVKVFYRAKSNVSNVSVGYSLISETPNQLRTYGIYFSPNTAQASGSNSVSPISIVSEFTGTGCMATATTDWSSTLAVSNSSYVSGTSMA